MKNLLASNKDTIYALSTAQAKAGIAVIRVSGESALTTQKLFLTKITKARFAYYTRLQTSAGELIDNVLILYFKAPHSFTGEDVVEIHTHGSRAVVNMLLEELSSFSNFRLATPGEFSFRAFQNGKMDLTQTEGLADLIDAETKAQLNQALRQYNGQTKERISLWREELVRIMSLIEAYIDFPDEDLPNDLIDNIYEDTNRLKLELINNLSDNHMGERVRDGLNIAIIGEPNVGKSSLLNLLAKREIAIVSEVAGTTRDSLEVHLDISGYPVTLHDTAGLRETSDIVERKGVQIAENKAANADLKLIIVDSTKKLIPAYISQYIDNNSIIIANKMDLVDTPLHYSQEHEQINISVKSENNIERLVKRIDKFTQKFFSNYENSIIFRQRHREALEKCLEALDKFSLDKEIELAAEDLRVAAGYLSRITGEINVESVLDKIFSSFCIGK